MQTNIFIYLFLIMIRSSYLKLVFFFLSTVSYFAQEKLNILHRNEIIVEGFLGFPYNLPLPLTVRQSGEPDINLTADFASKPFEIPVYWVWRISYWDNKKSWELEAIHHKLFLKNNPPEIQDFSISHGLNLITINRGWQFRNFILRAGAGIVIAHPESIIRNKKFPENAGIFNWGYYFAGPAVNISASKAFEIINCLYAVCELKLSSSYSHVPVYNGSADLFNTAVQLNIGLGISLLKF